MTVWPKIILVSEVNEAIDANLDNHLNIVCQEKFENDRNQRLLTFTTLKLKVNAICRAGSQTRDGET